MANKIKKLLHKVIKRKPASSQHALASTSKPRTSYSSLGLDHELGEVPKALSTSRNRSGSLISRISVSSINNGSFYSHNTGSPVQLRATLGQASEHVAAVANAAHLASLARKELQQADWELNAAPLSRQASTCFPSRKVSLQSLAEDQAALLEQLGSVVESEAATTRDASIATGAPPYLPEHAPVPAPRTSSLRLVVKSLTPRASTIPARNRSGTLETLVEDLSPDSPAISASESMSKSVEVSQTSSASADLTNGSLDSEIPNGSPPSHGKLRLTITKLASTRSRRAIRRTPRAEQRHW